MVVCGLIPGIYEGFVQAMHAIGWAEESVVVKADSMDEATRIYGFVTETGDVKVTAICSCPIHGHVKGAHA